MIWKRKATVATHLNLSGWFALQAYSSRDLRGLTVQHSHDTFKEGRSVILTLQDRGMLAYRFKILDLLLLLGRKHHSLKIG